MADSGEKLSLGQAAKLAGRSKPTISAWLKSGRISGTKRPDGIYEIDPAEILRIGDARTGPQKGRKPAAQRGDAAGTRASRESAADVEIRLLREQVDDLTRREALARGEAADALARERALADRISGLLEGPKKQSLWTRILGRDEI